LNCTVQKTIMLTNLSLVIAILSFGTPLFVLIVFLPAIIELWKPKDCGPRMITYRVPNAGLATGPLNYLANIEEDQQFASSVFHPLMKILESLPNLEV
jgi:hypothetical protein